MSNMTEKLYKEIHKFIRWADRIILTGEKKMIMVNGNSGTVLILMKCTKQ